MFFSPSKHAITQLAKDLCNTYPLLGDPIANENGYTMWFFHASGLPCATGFLEERVKSQRQAFLKQCGEAMKKDKGVGKIILSGWESAEGQVILMIKNPYYIMLIC